MEQVSVKLEVKLDRLTRDTKIVMALSIVSIFMTPVFLVALIYFIITVSKISKLKNNQSLEGILNGLKSKTTKELKSIKGNNESLEQRVAGLLLAKKFMVVAFIIVAAIMAIVIGIIATSTPLGIEMV